MISNDGFSPDWVSAPGETIIDLMDTYGLNEEELSKKVGLSVSKGRELISGELVLTEKIANKLEFIFDVSTQFWLTREEKYRDRKNAIELQNTEWVKSLPTSDMSRLGWLPKGLSGSKKLEHCLSFFGVSSVPEWLNFYKNKQTAIAFRKSEAFKTEEMAVLTWLKKAEHISRQQKTHSWDKEVLIASINDIRKHSLEPHPKVFIPAIRAILADAGVALVILPTPTGCPASGATCFFEQNKATLIMSFRYLRDDHFWFTLFHEIGHLVLHNCKQHRIEGVSGLSEKEEQEANEFSSNVLIPQEYRAEFNTLSSRNWINIVKFSRKIGVSKGIVLGQLQHAKKVPFDHFSKFKVKYNREDLC
ncbi:ImmA/IrrE family metallo-endopeptidase [Serratia fonticola]|nr:ImmA/IrrE family metallo-endopeptidase [Serratia fonticola]